MDAMIRTKDGKEFVLGDYDVIVKDFNVSSIQLEPTYAKIEGADGSVDMGATADSRTITLPITMKANDLLDYPLLRDVIFDLMVSKESFYIHEMRRPKQMAYEFVDTNEAPKDNAESDNVVVTGKRYLVRLSNQFEFDQLNVYGDAELIFETTELPYAESIGTSMDIELNGIDSSSYLWSFGMGIIDEPSSRIYRFNNMINGKTFKVFNMGNVPLNVYEHEFEIKIRRTHYASEGFEVLNRTNGTHFKVKEYLSNSDEIVISGGQILKNNSNFLRGTTRDTIELDVGWNDLVILGSADQLNIEFDTRFYYK